MQAIFAGYVSGVQEPHCEERKTDLSYSQLRFFAPPNSKYPKQWAWLCGEGIRVGEVSRLEAASKDIRPLTALGCSSPSRLTAPLP